MEFTAMPPGSEIEIVVKKFDFEKVMAYGSVVGKIEISFSQTDFGGGSKALGSVPAGKRVWAAVIIVNEVFNAGTLTIGDASAHSRLMAATANYLTQAGIYEVNPQHLYSAETPIKLWFSGSPVSGSGTAIIFFD